jgi:hypothetical protein
MVAEYGDPWRAEFNYSSNVKARIEIKTFTDFGVNQSGMWRIDAGEVGRCQSAAGRANSYRLLFCGRQRIRHPFELIDLPC